MSIPAFVAKWSASTRTERAAAQEHFIDLCRVLGQQTPNEADPRGDFYAFEKGATKSTGGQGFADVWMRGHFAWEYKRHRANLDAAYQQVQLYRDALENPPLLVVCDLNRFEVHTNFTATARRVYAFDLADLQTNVPTATCDRPPLDVLRAVFTAPDRLRPTRTTAQVTEAAAAEFAKLSKSLHDRGADPERAAHFLMRLLFCLFAEDTELLPSRLFTKVVESARFRPTEFGKPLRDLFSAMAEGGWFGGDYIAYFNGGLFTDADTLDVTAGDIEVLFEACKLDWTSIEPAIFGTLFERSLDPSKRKQWGAHYTSRDDILLIVEPVVMAPLRHRWAEVQEQAAGPIAQRDALLGKSDPASRRARTLHEGTILRLLTDFVEELAAFQVLDPACGSGNFLYVTLKQLLDLEKQVVIFAGANGLSAWFPRVGPEQLYGIEMNTYAHELAQVVVWIGYIQWLRDNGFGSPSAPILKPLDTIRHSDAILVKGADGKVCETPWPVADVIIGNPPYLGNRRMRLELGNDYVDALRRLYADRVPRGADLVCFWFERARAQIEAQHASRAGLLATQGIRGGANRKVLERIKQTGDIFWAVSDRDWILDGANVHVSMIGFDGGSETARVLDGRSGATINADLTSTADLTRARRLRENLRLAFMATVKVGPFDISAALASKLLSAPLNPNGRPNSDVVKPWINALDVTRRPRRMWIIDFGVNMLEQDAALYEAPFEYIREHVFPVRSQNRKAPYARRWWLFAEPCPGMRDAIREKSRYIVTPTLAKHRLFAWAYQPTVPDHQLIVIARDDDYFLGILHSRPHELWALRLGTALEDRPRYTPTTTFETFPFPWPPGKEPAADSRVQAVAEASRELVERRDGWLNPPGARDADLKDRTLTNLYNRRPAWLDMAHEKLDRAVFDAYGWPHDLTDEEILERLLALNLARQAV